MLAWHLRIFGRGVEDWCPIEVLKVKVEYYKWGSVEMLATWKSIRRTTFLECLILILRRNWLVA
jgi:hypothetical protein